MAIPTDASNQGINLLGMKAELETNVYVAVPNAERERVGVSLRSLASSYSINQNSASKPTFDGNAAWASGRSVSMKQYAGYDHDAVAAAFDAISFDFDGTNDRLEGSGSLAQQFIGSNSQVGAGSVSAWVKLDSMSGNGFIFQLSPEEGTTNLVLLLWNNAAGRIRGNVKVSGVTNVVNSQAGLENDGNWHHVVLTWEYGSKTSSNNEVKIYIDASLKATDAIGSNKWNDGNGPAVVGFGRNHPPGNTNPFNGHMNDIALFSDKLTASEITSIYNSGEPKDESSHSGLISYYTMEDYSNGDTSLADDSSNSYNLTITNSTDIDSTDTP